MICLKVLTLFLSAVCLVGCTSTYSDQDTIIEEEPVEPEIIDEPIDGGSTTYIDENAPKEIASKDITYFEALFYSNTRWSGEDDYDFHFIVSSDSGAMISSEETRHISVPASSDLLDSLQEVIDKYNLVKMNGIYDVTAGLAPEYFPGGLTVKYASGKELHFTTDNNPYALWSEEMYDIFAAWFSENGDDSLYPAKDDSQIVRFNFLYEENRKTIDYRGMNVPDKKSESGKTYVLKLQNDNRLFGTKEMPFPDDYYEKITQIIGETNLDRNYRFSAYDHEASNYNSSARKPRP